ncbi:hypothetical protein [Natronobacterium gregoryi]|uniref:Uncharacterized protein n=2 Tax=Natronobacterium gregoryi TaxID=44930 RepID=L0AEZ8_NATGS|nr:hypothetical protein [Natronobacterium gregoryi]AFZ71702.1 hypothetical protein Natgr_0447 [Natronobacterium gregoryi SP2]ELY72726.1 hypothetical protein C490_02788 [Natronobacterium gregoryi SP2]PLK20250.1 hypothetical protein CYV19_10490 [Natronobacterium gregoryi SP2]SFJ26091.1 hypothetical protein SAMN05443661_11942 [Natronobacterium gregoryi]
MTKDDSTETEKGPLRILKKTAATVYRQHMRRKTTYTTWGRTMNRYSASQQRSNEVQFREPRHPCENPLLLVCCETDSEEWYFEVASHGDHLVATAACRIDRRPDGKEPQSLGDASLVPKDIEQAVLEYDGPHAVDVVRNPTTERGD